MEIEREIEKDRFCANKNGPVDYHTQPGSIIFVNLTTLIINCSS